MKENSNRLYYWDAWRTSFAARIVETVLQNRRQAVVLDNTYFYPASGGQPADRGWLNGVPVVDVSIRPEDGAVLHWLGDGDLGGEMVSAVIDWPRRFDHMQQHTGQHILSQAFWRVAQAETIGFHLTESNLTIDLNISSLSDEVVRKAEQLANQIVWENRAVHIRFVTREDALALPLRKIPPTENGWLRLIEIEGFDLTACGGTHVRQTGSVGVIKVIRAERRKNKMRIYFLCGGRAWQDYEGKNGVVAALMGMLTTGEAELVTAVSRLQEELKQTRRTLKHQQTQLLAAKAERLLASATKLGQTRLVCHISADEDANTLRQLGNQLAQQENVIALLGLAGSRSFLFFVRSEDAPGDMKALLQTAVQILGGGGGGTAVSAQGGGPPATPDTLQSVFNQITQELHKLI